MALQSKTAIKSYFQTNDVPTQEEFEHLIDSCHNEVIPAGSPTSDIQAAIDALTGFPGGVVVLGPGEHTVTETINLKSGVVLAGRGKFQTWLKLANSANCDMIKLAEDTTEMWGIGQLGLDGNRSNQGADAGTDATNYRGVHLLGTSSPGQHTSALTGLTDPRGVINNIFLWNIKGDGFFMEQSRELMMHNVDVAFCGRRCMYSRTVDSFFTNLSLGPCELGANIWHGASNRYANVKIWGSGNGNDSGGAVTDLWNAIRTALIANDGSAGYDYTNAGGMADNNMAGCGLVMKDNKTTVNGIQFQDTDGTGLYYAGGDAIFSGVSFDRIGEISDQWGIATTMSDGGLPAAKYTVRHNSGKLILQGVATGTAARASRPGTGLYFHSSAGEFDISLVAEDSFTTTEVDSSNLSASVAGKLFTDTGARFFGATWERPVQIGTMFMWDDEAGAIRVKSSAPANATDGTTI